MKLLLLETCSLQCLEMKVYLCEVLLILGHEEGWRGCLWRDPTPWVFLRKCKLLDKMFRNEESKHFPGTMKCSKHLRKIPGKGRVWKLIPKPRIAVSFRKIIIFFAQESEDHGESPWLLECSCHFSPNYQHLLLSSYFLPGLSKWSRHWIVGLIVSNVTKALYRFELSQSMQKFQKVSLRSLPGHVH